MIKKNESNKIRRKMGAFIAFNIYSSFLISAFQENIPHLFDNRIVSQMIEKGIPVNLDHWGWNGHYIWRLIASIIVTGIVGFLSGAISNDKGGKVAAISNIPSILLWVGTLYLAALTDVPFAKAKTGFAVISIVAIPLTTCIAYGAGNWGEKIQKRGYREDTVLGIYPYNYVWMVWPLYWYSLRIIFVVVKFIGLQILSSDYLSIYTNILYLLGIVPVIFWMCPLILVYAILSGEIMSRQTKLIKFFANAGIMIIGALFAEGSVGVCYWLINKMAT